MIPTDYITQWRKTAPWPSNEQVEQDLVISRAIVAIFNEEEIVKRLAWRGGTALHKLYIQPAPRYSEDIDLVQVDAEPIGNTLDRLRQVLDSWLGKPRRVFKEGRVNLVYRFDSEGPPVVPLRLKIEINTREHFTELGYQSLPFAVNSKWFQGSTKVTTFRFEELLGTKLRALYQRKKGRDLFDLWSGMTTNSNVNVNVKHIITCFQRYMRESGHHISRAQFEENLASKRIDSRFVSDINPLLKPNSKWDINTAMDTVLHNIIANIPGAPWKVTCESSPNN